MELPLFPLNAVLFPGGVLPLRIFEPRYLDMVKDCVREQSEFVICLIREGDEVGKAVHHCNIGTACKITDWETLPEGLLGITVQGIRRVTINSVEVQTNQLLVGNVDGLTEDQDEELPAEFNEWAHLVSLIINKLGKPFSEQQFHLNSASWVGARLTEYLPFELAAKQRILEIDHPLVRLEHLQDSLEHIEKYYTKGNFESQ